jgi:hypothetical protein
MIRHIINEKQKHLLIGGLFIVIFLYFGILKKFHILFLEQNQLFLFNPEYLKEYLSLPGSLASYIGSFFTQFFISSWIGALIFTLATFTVFILTNYIYRKHNINNIILSFVPVWLMVILLSDESFSFDQATGFIVSLSFFSLYISIDNSKLRKVLYFIGWPVLYLIAGRYSFAIIFLGAFHEMLFREKKSRFIIFVLYIILGALIPYLITEYIYYIPSDKIFAYPELTLRNTLSRHALTVILFWYPSLIIIKYFLNRLSNKNNRLLPWSLINVLVGTIIFSIMGFIVIRYSYNKRLEIMKEMDHHIQLADWEKVLKLSDKYPDYNTLMIYYTNLALYKTKHLCDRMFKYPQIGKTGLSLSWYNKINIFYGSDVFYHLSYINEAYRWAFEAMVQKGQNPRSLKMLVLTSIINGDNAVAEKFLNQLDQTLFYRKWAQHYKEYLLNPTLAENDPEILQKKDLQIHSDFFAIANDLDLIHLLAENPENKMAYEYLMASFLLEKDLEGFGRLILKIGDYDYKSIPLHFEEALIICNNSGMNVMPEGFSLNPETIRKYNHYTSTYSTYRSNPDIAKEVLKKRYGGTYWFYLHFI